MEAEEEIELLIASSVEDEPDVDPLGWLPQLVVLGEWKDQASYNASITRVHAAFTSDFGRRSATLYFQGREVRTKFHPDAMGDGRGATFWHLITEGTDGKRSEDNRAAIGSRCERIGWIAAIIREAAAAVASRVRVWRQRRPKAKDRWAIALDDFSYLVILEDRGEFVLLWTAFPVEHEHSRRKYRTEYEAFVRGPPRP